MYAHTHIFNTGGDIFAFQRDALIMLIYLKHDFYTYWELMFRIGGKDIPTHLSEPIISMGFWGNMSNYLMVKLYTIFSFISSPTLINISIFFSFIGFMGKFLILKAIENKSLGKFQFYTLAFILFYLPNESFWTNAIHKETLLTFAIGLVIYAFSLSVWYRWAMVVFGMTLMFIVRDFYFMSFLMGLFIYYLMNETKLKLRQVILVTSFFILILFSLPIKFGKTLFHVLIDKKTEFSSMNHGHTKIETLHFLQKPLESIYNTILNGFIEPSFWHIRNAFELVISIENFLISIILLFFIYAIFKAKSFQFFGFYVFAILIIFSCGYLVPNIGAILRYRSVAYITLVFTLCYEYFLIQNRKTY